MVIFLIIVILCFLSFIVYVLMKDLLMKKLLLLALSFFVITNSTYGMNRDGLFNVIVALLDKNPEDLFEFLDAGGELYQTEFYGNTALMDACLTDDLAYVQALCSHDNVKKIIDMKRSIDGNTALHLAIVMGNADIVSILINKGKADLTIVNKLGQTPFALIEFFLRNINEIHPILREKILRVRAILIKKIHEILTNACAERDIEAVREFCSSFDVNLLNTFYSPPCLMPGNFRVFNHVTVLDVVDCCLRWKALNLETKAQYLVIKNILIQAGALYAHQVKEPMAQHN